MKVRKGQSQPIPTIRSCGRLLNSLHGPGRSIFIPGFDYDSDVLNKRWIESPRSRSDLLGCGKLGPRYEGQAVSTAGSLGRAGLARWRWNFGCQDVVLLLKPFWDPIVVGIAEFATHVRTYFAVGIGMLTGG